MPVGAIAPRRGAAGLWSRYAAWRDVAPDVRHERAGFIARVATLARERGPLIVYPGWNESIDALLDARDELPGEVQLPYGDARSVRELQDKGALPRHAGEAGLSTPATLIEASAGELLDVRIGAPCVIKPSRSVSALGATHVIDSEHEAQRLLRSVPGDERVLVQERAAGRLAGLAIVIDRRGRVVARHQQEATRTWPPRAGTIAYATSVAPDGDLVEGVARLLRSVGFFGLAQLDFMRAGDRYALIDVNPRFYCTLPLALASGVNLPAAWHATVVDRALPSPGPYRLGVSFRWFQADLSAALRGSPKQLLRRAPAPRSGPMWAGDDPLPGLMLNAEAIAARFRRRLPGVERAGKSRRDAVRVA